MKKLTPEKSIKELERIKVEMYQLCKEDVENIISNNIREKNRIERLFDYLFVFNPDENFMALFWKMINYVETFDTEIGAFYRRTGEYGLLKQG